MSSKFHRSNQVGEAVEVEAFRRCPKAVRRGIREVEAADVKAREADNNSKQNSSSSSSAYSVGESVGTLSL